MPGGRGKIKPKDGIPFKKDDPRINRKGRPLKLPDLDTLLAELLAEEKNGISAMKIILMSIRKNAVEGDIRSAELLIDRAYGKLKQTTDINMDFDKMTEGQLDEIIVRILNKQR